MNKPMFLQDLKNKRSKHATKSTLAFMAEYSDKYRVKEIVKNKAPSLKVAKVYGTYKKFEDITLEDLPQKFVIKVNHWTGDSTVIESHSEFKQNYVKMSNFFNKILTQKFGSNIEKHYELIGPVLFIEEYITEDIRELKVHVIWGIPVFIHYIDYKKSIHKCYDMNWNELNFVNYKGNNDYSKQSQIDKPKQLFEIVQHSLDLCANINYVRLDFFLTKEYDIYFGEFTFTPAGFRKTYLSDEIYDIMYMMYKSKNVDLNLIDPLIK